MKKWLVRAKRTSKTKPKRPIYHDWEFHAPGHAQALVRARKYAQDIADRFELQVTFTLKEVKARKNPKRKNPAHAKRFEYRYPVPPGPTGNWSEDDWLRYEDSRGSWVDTEPETIPWSDTQHSVKTGRRTAKGEMLYRLADRLTLTEHDLVGDEWDVWGMINSAMTTDAEELHAQYKRFDSSMTLRHIRKALKGLLDKGFITRATGMGRGVHKTKPLTYIGKKNPRHDTSGEFVAYGRSAQEARERAKAAAPSGFEPYDLGLVGHPLHSDEYSYKLRRKRKSRKGKSLKGKRRATRNPRRRS